MRTQKHIFNNLLLSYNKYVRKLNKLVTNHLNSKKQRILEKRIIRLFRKLSSIHFSFKKSAIGIAVGGTLLVLKPNTAKSQNFEVQQLNPFGLSNTSLFDNNLNIVDFDGDNDLDIIASTPNAEGYSIIGNNYYFENVGTNTNSQFNEPILNPSWIPQNFLISELVDIDGDGDFDIFSRDNDFIQNIGTATEPNFILIDPNPFSFAGKQLQFSDLDTDGDLDAITLEESTFLFYENIGTSENPIFNSFTINPFSINTSELYTLNSHSYSDIDNDGDIDLMTIQNFGYTYQNIILYYENVGTSFAPEFANFSFDNFNLPGSVSNSQVSITTATSDFADLNNDGLLDFLVLTNGSFLYYENQNNCPKVFSLFENLEENGYSLHWEAPSGSTKCQITGGIADKSRRFTKTILGIEPSSVFVSESFLRAQTNYEWSVKCNCEDNIEYGPSSEFNYFMTGNDLDFGFPKSNDQNIFEIESNIVTTLANIKMFPNPAKGSFAINTDLKNYNVELRDVTGKLVYKQNNINQTTINFDIKHVEAGTYFVTINNANSSEVIKLMVY